MAEEKSRFGPVDFSFRGMKGTEKYPYRRYELPFTESKKIYHYTTVPGAKGIVDAGSIWLTSIKYMNDADEIYHGRRIAAAVAKRAISREGNIHVKYVLESVVSELESPVLPDLYIACFAKEGDSLDLWRTYSKGVVGVSIGIDLTLPHHFQVMPIFTLQDVMYHDHGIARRVTKEIERLKICISRDEGVYGNGNMIEGYRDDYIRTMLVKLENICVTSKNAGFSSEKEVRLSYVSRNGARLRKEYRSTDKYIIPYCNSASVMDGSKEGRPLPVSDIIVGPSLKSDLVLESIQDYMRDAGLNIEVKHSKLPFRQI